MRDTIFSRQHLRDTISHYFSFRFVARSFVCSSFGCKPLSLWKSSSFISDESRGASGVDRIATECENPRKEIKDGIMDAVTQVERTMPAELTSNDRQQEPSAIRTVASKQAQCGVLSEGKDHAPGTSPLKAPASKYRHLPPIPAATPRDDDAGRIRLGICAMDKKARSKPMAEILSRLDENLFCVVFFGDAVLLKEPAEAWPLCDVLVAFFSKGYPLRKAKEYVELRKPFIFNDLGMQELLQDRRRVYDCLEAAGIDVPRHAYLSRDGYTSTGLGDGNGAMDQEVQEFDDHIIVNGIAINKPFVEKPVNAEGECSDILANALALSLSYMSTSPMSTTRPVC